jgi:hypothetical protein
VTKPNIASAGAQSTLPRRRLIETTLGITALAVGGAVKVQQPKPDAELHQLVADFAPLHAEARRVSAIYSAVLPSEPGYRAAQVASDAASGRAWEVWDEIVRTPARTSEGIQAKLGVLALRDPRRFSSSAGDALHAMTASVLRDMLGRA